MFVKRVRRTVTRHTRIVIFKNRLAKSLIWFAAGITMSILVLIMGYILFNGIYTRSRISDPVADYTKESLTIGNKDMVILVSRSLRLDNLSFDELQEIYMGMNRFWGYKTGQNRTIAPYIYQGEGVEFEDLDNYFFNGEELMGVSIKFLHQLPMLQELMDRSSGAIAIVPQEWADKVSGAKSVPLRNLSLAVHPDLTELNNGRRLEKIRRSDLNRLSFGKIRSWKELNGPDIVPIPVVLDKSDHLSLFPEGILSENSVYVNSEEEFISVLQSTPGSYGALSRRAVLFHELHALEIQRSTGSFNLRPSFFFKPPSRAGAVGGISSIIINTIVMVLVVLLIATPIGVGAAVYLVEYSRQGKLLTILRIGTDTLAGIPSIIFGLFGLVFFSQFLGLKTGLLAGSLTLTLMILPTIVRTAEEALRSVPKELKEGSLAMGATKYQTIIRVVLPAAAPGILSGIILAIGRAIGETAALLFTMGSNMALLKSLNSPMRVLSVHLYMLIRENISMPNAFASAAILVMLVFLVNWLTKRLMGRLSVSR